MDGHAVTTVRALLASCREAGVLVRLGDADLRLRSPMGPPPAELLDALRVHKPDVVAYLRDARTAHVHPCACCGRFFFPEPAITCYRCRLEGIGAPQAGDPCDGCGEACDRCVPGHRDKRAA